MNSQTKQNCDVKKYNAELRVFTMLYSVTCYVIGVVALIYLILFIADLLVPVSINSGAGIAPM